ncbi:16S rRNA (cytidine(1402)-2'-O)-methyltransferase [Prochlorococcus marinus]|uniref:16S rRNA (cytidine(1402)-2'-O)-methyltransferase n=1 Tax=Prochlorococcus marinus TaxID=1219 RepID=UPI0022B560B9|nr:16S rRNA (cytidine(1402)-2'-O)-methyltransferase [Prochlorococcus marinus]
MDLIDDQQPQQERSEPCPGTLYIVGTPIGNLGDLSPRAKSILKNVSLIACEDSRRSGKLMKIIESKVPLLSYHKHNFKSRQSQLLEILESGGSLALISDAGLPGINDPGQELVHAAKSKSYEVICIPGPCAAITALVISGLPSERFCFEGFLPKKQSIRKKRLEDISQEQRTSVIYESPHHLIKLLEDLSNLCGNKRPIQIARELTKRYEESIGKTIEEVLRYFIVNKPKGEFTIVLGGNSNNNNNNRISESEALNKLHELIKQGEKSNIAARKIAEETGYEKKWLYSKLHKKLDK